MTAERPASARHPHADARYRIIARRDGFGIEVTIPETNPTMITGFATEEAAEGWIAAHRRQIETAPTHWRRGVRRNADPAAPGPGGR